jgi:tetratricopeptide (TPR) repeat protein
MLTSKGQAKITDFGLAKLPGRTKLTKTGTTVGTLAYMSPEQAQGAEVDHRSDIWSLGVVLYELLTGNVPFRGDHEAAMVYSIMNEDVAPPSNLTPDVPAELDSIVAKTLQKNPDDRYATTEELLSDLRKVQAGAAVKVALPMSRKAKRVMWALSAVVVIAAVVLSLVLLNREPVTLSAIKENSLAIMYFENLVDKEDQLLGDMITNLLITDLAESEYIQVVSYQRLYDILRIIGKEGLKKIDRTVATEVAKRAGVENMLLGSISQLGGQKILTSRLVDVGSGRVTKSQKVDGTDIYAMVDQLTQEVKNDLSLPEQALAEEDRSITELSTESEDAYRYYLQGLDLENRFSGVEALEKYETALEYDSTFAAAHYRMALVYGYENSKLSRLSLEKALRDSVKAPEKDRMYIRAAYYSTYSPGRHNPIKAEGIYKDIINRYPNEKEAHAHLASIKVDQEEYAEATKLYETALEIDPNYSQAMLSLSWVHSDQKNYSKAEALLTRYISLRPNDHQGHHYLGWVYLESGAYDKAIEEFGLSLELRPHYSWSHMAIGYIHILEKEYENAREAFAKIVLPADTLRIYTSKEHFVLTYLFEGEFDKAVEIQQEAIEICSKAKEIVHQNDLLNDLGRYYFGLGKYDLSLKCFEKAKDLNVDWYESAIVIEIHMINKNFRKAQEIWDAGRKRWEGKLFPQDMVANECHLKGVMEREKGNYNESIKYLLKSRELSKHPNTHDFTLGKVYLLHRDFRKAEEEFLKVINGWYRCIRPIRCVKSFYYLAKVKDGLHDQEEAIKYYEEFLDHWGNGDWDLPEIADAKEQLERLRAAH